MAIAIAIIIVCIAVGVPSLSAYRIIRDNRTYVPPTPRERRTRHETLRARISDPPADPQTAMFVLDQAKESLQSVLDANKSLEDKAKSLLTIAVGGSGALAIVGPTHAHMTATPYLCASVLLALVALLCCLAALRVKYRPGVTVHDFIGAPTARDPNIRFAMALSLAEDYAVKAAEVGEARRLDPALVSGARWALIGAVALLLANFVAAPASSTDCPVVRSGTGTLVAKCPVP